jgi:hypothetical protein
MQAGIVVCMLFSVNCQFSANPLDAGTANGFVSSWLLCQLGSPFCGGRTGASRTSQELSTDVNGDGYSDRLIAAYGNQGGGAADKGAVYVYYGGASGITLHPASGSGYACSGPPDCTAVQNPENEGTGRFGQDSGALGDVNGDGFADFVVGARNNQGAGAADKGAVYVYYGSASGITLHDLSATPYTCSGPPDCTVVQNPDNESSGGFGLSARGGRRCERRWFSRYDRGCIWKSRRGRRRQRSRVYLLWQRQRNYLTPAFGRRVFMHRPSGLHRHSEPRR